MTDEQILLELQQIKQELQPKRSWRIIRENLLAGMFHSIGYFLGTILIFWLLFLFVRQFNVPELISRQFETIMSQIQWDKVLPAPTPEL